MSQSDHDTELGSETCPQLAAAQTTSLGKPPLAQPIAPQRDEMGAWQHPSFPWNEVPENGSLESYISEWGYEACYCQMESEADAEKLLALMAEHGGSFAHWSPTQPAGDGWFLGAIYDSEAGPTAVWLRPKTFAAETELACAAILEGMNRPRDPGWSYRDTFLFRRAGMDALVARIRKALATKTSSAQAEPVAQLDEDQAAAVRFWQDNPSAALVAFGRWIRADEKMKRTATRPAQAEPPRWHDLVNRAMDLASLHAGSVGMNDVEGARGYANDLRRLLVEHMLPAQAEPVAHALKSLTDDECDRVLAEALDAVAKKAGHGMSWADVNTDIASNGVLRRELVRRAALAAADAPAEPVALHPATDDLVTRFAAALREKLAFAERKYGYSDGWQSPDWMGECRQHLLEHIAKGDPRDVAAYCAFLWHHGERTSAQPTQAKPVAYAGYHGDFAEPVALWSREHGERLASVLTEIEYAVAHG
jgi:hypothetical protein